MKTSAKSRISSDRGSLLIVAMILMAAIGISLASYLSLSRSTMKISNRGFYANAAMNLAENGLEEGMYSINKKVLDSTYDWSASGWTIVGSDAKRTLSGYTLDQNVTGKVDVVVYNYLGVTAPTIIAHSTINLAAGQGPAIEKWVKVQLRMASRYANGLVGKDGVTFKGNNATVDSWNSMRKDDGTARASPTPYSSSGASKNNHDQGTVASLTVSVDTVLVQNADIWGYAKTGSKDQPPTVGPQGTIGPFGTSTGSVDASRITYDFSMPIEVQPTISTGTTRAAISNDTTLGTAGSNTIWRIPSISLAGSKTLNIAGDVTIVLTGGGPGTNVLSVGGNAGINIPAGSSLKIYAEGDIDLAGNGVANSNVLAQSFLIYGTSTSTSSFQKIGIKGNGALVAVVDAPNSDVTINGNGDVQGSVVGKTITLTGNALFHYDESLADAGSGNPYRISRWQELTSSASRHF